VFLENRGTSNTLGPKSKDGIRKQLGVCNMNEELQNNRTNWLDHLEGMEKDCIPKTYKCLLHEV
jgi:hypothetical protein